MRPWPALLLATALVAGPLAGTLASPAAAAGDPNTERMKACAAHWGEMKRAGRTNGQSYQQFCRTMLAQPARAAAPQPKARPAGPPAGATARCKDGSFTTAPKGKPGACSGHGGVAGWLG